MFRFFSVNLNPFVLQIQALNANAYISSSHSFQLLGHACCQVEGGGKY